MSNGPTPDDLRAKVFEDSEAPGDWRVEKFDEDGGCEVTVFGGSRGAGAGHPVCRSRIRRV